MRILQAILVSCLLLVAVIPFPSFSAAAQISVIEVREPHPFMGGDLSDRKRENIEERVYHSGDREESSTERLLRPSKKTAIPPKFRLKDPRRNPTDTFKYPQDVVRAYFDYLTNAENMGEYHAGCGSIGEAKIPFPHAYRLLSDGYRQQWTYEKFLKSFEGVGHTNLLQILQAPLETVKSTHPTYFVEIETIEGSNQPGRGTAFRYYYGYVTAVKVGEDGWKIDKIDFHPEDFLCYPYHGWWHDGPEVVAITYGGWCNLFDRDDPGRVKHKDGLIEVTRKGKDGTQYRFVFTRLTNGFDEKIGQYRKGPGGEWEPSVFEAEKCVDYRNRG